MGSKEVLPFLGLGNIALHSGDLTKRKNGSSRRATCKRNIRPYCLPGDDWNRQRTALKDEAQSKKQLQEARALLEKCMLKGEDSATFHSEMGAVYYKLAMWEKAAESYTEQALRMRRRRNDLRFALGQSYAQ